MLFLVFGLFFLIFLYLQFGPPGFLIYLMVGFLIGVPVALLFKEAVEKNTDDVEPKTIRNSIKQKLIDCIKTFNPAERLTLELALPTVIFFIALYIAIAWLPLVAECLWNEIIIIALKIKILFFAYQFKFLLWRYKRRLKKLFSKLHIILSEEEKNKPEMRDLLEKIRLILNEDKL